MDITFKEVIPILRIFDIEGGRILPRLRRCPGAHARATTRGIEALERELIARRYGFGRPISSAPVGT